MLWLSNKGRRAQPPAQVGSSLGLLGKEETFQATGSQDSKLPSMPKSHLLTFALALPGAFAEGLEA